ncbi:lysostaphin resistance A-like protein [Microbacterium sp.]|uniref:CPBP family intramembrane glutamic endopeptidase n=1 Tax=Microbacterium sp. TaxID=51671 RepID=UPI0039E5C154
MTMPPAPPLPPLPPVPAGDVPAGGGMPASPAYPPAFVPVVPPQQVVLPPLPRDATTGGLAFHRLVFARRRWGWWTPLAVGGLGLAFYLALTMVLVAVMVVAMLNDPTAFDSLETFTQTMTIDTSDPFMLAIALGSIALMLPSYQLASLIVNGTRLGLISSAAGRLRWAWMLRCGVVALVVAIVLTGLMLLIPGEAPGGALSPLWAVSLLIVLLLVPVQAAAEEYVFRGYLAQAIGRWLRHPAFAILLPVPLFMLGHLYDWVGQLGVGLFAVAAGWLTWRTGGLEAAIALHVVNNTVAFVLAVVTGSDPTETDTSVVSFLWSLLLIGCYVGIVEWMLRRRPLARTVVITPPLPAAPAFPAAVSSSAS